MPFYLVEGVYTRETLKTLVGNPQSRLKPVTDMLAKVGGKLHHQFFVLGECDMIALYEVPDDVDGAGGVGTGPATRVLDRLARLFKCWE